MVKYDELRNELSELKQIYTKFLFAAMDELEESMEEVESSVQEEVDIMFNKYTKKRITDPKEVYIELLDEEQDDICVVKAKIIALEKILEEVK